MKHPMAIIAALLIVCAVSSCSKNDDTHTNDGTILTRYKTTFRDTLVFYWIYDRDANNRIITMRDSTKAYENTSRMVYGSNGKLEKINYLLPGTTSVVYSYEYSYNSDGRISKRKVRSGIITVSEDYNVYVYDATGHLMVDSQYTAVNNVTFKLSRVAKFQYTGDNVTIGEDYDLATGAPVLYSRVKYEYDNAINPFKNLEYEYYFNEAGSAIYTITQMSGNNVVKMDQTGGNSSLNYQYTATHQYNSNNYAWKSTVSTSQPNKRSETEYFFQ